ncbi:MAG: hypothetical protein ACRDA0_07165 [Cetobacterium sp.]
MFLTPEEKIVFLRKKYNITQKELSSSNLTRQFIGMIEIGKRGLTYKTAKIVAENFNTLLKSKNSATIITPEFLLESKTEQALKKLKTVIESRQVNDNLEIEICFAELDNLNKKKLSILLGILYFELEQISASKKYLEIALTLHKPLENLEILLYLGRIFYYENNFFNFVNLISPDLTKLLKNNTEISTKILYNYAYSLYKIKDIEASNKILNTLLKRKNESEINFKINNLIAVISYSEFNKANKAIKSYKNMLENSTVEEKLVIYGNYLEIFLINRVKIDFEEVKNNILKILDFYETSTDHKFKLYILIAKCYLALNNHKMAYYFYILGLELPDNNLISFDTKYEVTIDILKNISLDEIQMNEITEMFLKFFNLNKNYKMALTFIKNLKSEDRKLDILSKLEE